MDTRNAIERYLFARRAWRRPRLMPVTLAIGMILTVGALAHAQPAPISASGTDTPPRLDLRIKHHGEIQPRQLGNLIVTVGRQDGSVKLWSMRSLSLIKTLRNSRFTPRDAAVLEHNKLAVKDVRGDVYLCDMVSEKVLFKIFASTAGVDVHILGVGGQFLIIQGNATFKPLIWSARNHLAVNIDDSHFKDGSEIVYFDGKLVAFLDKNPYMFDGNDGPALYTYRLADRKITFLYKFDRRVKDYAFDASLREQGSLFALYTDDGNVYQFQASHPKLISQASIGLNNVILGYYQNTLVTEYTSHLESADRDSVLTFWTPHGQKKAEAISVNDYIYPIGFAADSKSFLGIGVFGGSYIVLSLAMHNATIENNVFSRQVSAVGRSNLPLAFGALENDLPTFDSPAPEAAAEAEVKTAGNHAVVAGVSPSGRYAVLFDTSSRFVGLEVFDNTSSKVTYSDVLGLHGGSSFSSDDRFLFGAAVDRNVVISDEYGIYDVKDGKVFYDVYHNFIMSLGSLKKFEIPNRNLVVYSTFAAKRRLLCLLYEGGGIEIWDPVASRLIQALQVDFTPIQAVFSPDDQQIALRSANGSLYSLNLDDTGKTEASEKSFQTSDIEPTGNISYSKSGRYILSKEPMTQIWNSESGVLLLSIAQFPGDEWVAVTPEGFFDASKNGAKYLNLVRGLKAYSLSQAYQSLYRPDLVREKLAGDPDGKVKAAATKLDLTKVVDSGAEPEVRFATNAGETSDKAQDVAVSVADAGGGVGKVEWRVNGVTQGIDEGGVARGTATDEDGDPKASGRAIDLHRVLQLEPGDNRIEVVAYNAANLIASDPVGITLTRKVEAVDQAAPATPRLFVLAVGINDYYDGRLRLAYAVPDAKALADGFRQAGAGLYADVQVTTLLDQDVTMAKLDQTFTELGGKIKPSDVFVFFIAGHGKTVDGHYHFIPYDFRYENAGSVLTGGIDQDHFQAWLSRIPARKSLMLTDTCESGSLTEDQQVASRGLEMVEAQAAAVELLTRAVGRTVLSASTDDAPALEGYHGHGVFSYVLLDALSHADVGGDGFITVTGLANYVDQQVPVVSYQAFKIRQIPERRVVGTDFPLVHRLSVALVTPDANAPVPTKPTHVVIAPVTVRATADDTGTAIVDLAPGSQVTLVQTANGWTVVARDGKRLGYVKDQSLARIQ